MGNETSVPDSDPQCPSPTDEKEELMYYQLAADGTCKFKNGESIRVIRSMLAFHSEFFTEEFFGPEPKTEVTITDFDRASFKTFLDCLFGAKEYTTPNALVIYPIADRYEVKESLDQCFSILEPEDMSDIVFHFLNSTTPYKSDKLTNSVINFVFTKYGIVHFLENEEYSSLLEPSGVLKLIKNDCLCSLVWTLVYQWGEKYLKKRDESDIKSFFIENGIFSEISLYHFESTKAIIDFHLMTNKQLFCPNEILHHLQINATGQNKTLPDRSDWVGVNAGDTFSETVILKNSFYSKTKKGHNALTISISTNKQTENYFDLKVRYVFRKITPNEEVSEESEGAFWRPDLNFFYSETDPSKMDYLVSPFSLGREFYIHFSGADLNKSVYKLLFTSPILSLEIHSLEITYICLNSCKILKRSLDTNENLIGRENDLYFTKDVSISKLGEQ